MHVLKTQEQYLTNEQVDEINYLKKIKGSLCKDCQNIIEEKIIRIALS